jgi:Coenzyme PQQ synthesis protein D (PqqD)
MHKSGELTTSQIAGAKVTLADSIRDAANQDGAILLDIEQGLCLSLNVVGAKIWQMLKENYTGDQIIACLAQDFVEVPRMQLEQDYVDFIRQLESNKLARLEILPARKTGIEKESISVERKSA